VLSYYRTARTAFPDQRHDKVRFHSSDDSVVAEFDMLGTNLGEFYGFPPTGKEFRVPVIAVFFFTRNGSPTSASTSMPPGCSVRSVASSCSAWPVGNDDNTRATFLQERDVSARSPGVNVARSTKRCTYGVPGVPGVPGLPGAAGHGHNLVWLVGCS
jgi:hypothetical protein